MGVKHAYRLWVTEAEQDAMVRVLGDCPQEPLPVGAAAPEVAPPGTPAAPGDDVTYSSCSAAREAGAAPVRAGDPGYGRHLDRDGDGVGCE